MKRGEAMSLIEKSDAQVKVDEDAGTAIINGEVTIEELHAILHILEYND